VSLEERFTECGLTLHPEKTKDSLAARMTTRRETYPDTSSTFSAIPSAEAVAAEAGYVWRLVQSGGQ